MKTEQRNVIICGVTLLLIIVIGVSFVKVKEGPKKIKAKKGSRKVKTKKNKRGGPQSAGPLSFSEPPSESKPNEKKEITLNGRSISYGPPKRVTKEKIMEKLKNEGKLS